MAPSSPIPAARRTERFHYAIRNVVAHARALEERGRAVRYLNIGDPTLYGYAPPPEIVEALARALRDRKHGYAPSEGLREAREAIARHMTTRRAARTEPSDVVVGAGASEAADLLLSALVEPGDEVLTPVPSYPLYGAILAKLGAVERTYRLRPELDWGPDLDELASRIGPRTRAVVVIHPNNPTGAVWSRDVLASLLAVLAKCPNVVLIADEVYADLAFDGPPPALAALAGDGVPVVTLDSFSKSYLVPGWRVGWLAFGRHPSLGAELRGAVRKLAEGRLCSPGPPQHAVAAGLDGPRTHLADVVSRMRASAEHVAARMARIPGVSCVPPRAAFYAMPRVPLRAGQTDERWVLDLLEATGNLLVHGSGFHMAPEDGFVRVVTLPSVAELDVVLDAIEGFVHRADAAGGGA
ncbi:MAG: aminotransferase class I/II-fold pyridoxal phosphate-dependent enzyme [Deltaproteobacteria bacterium]|nr:aminotransferase class I/II-fold pyridoxal phosphate-dependent enzyme [Deltaproteobacteria bacterium]